MILTELQGSATVIFTLCNNIPDIMTTFGEMDVDMRTPYFYSQSAVLVLTRNCRVFETSSRNPGNMNNNWRRLKRHSRDETKLSESRQKCSCHIRRPFYTELSSPEDADENRASDLFVNFLWTKKMKWAKSKVEKWSFSGLKSTKGGHYCAFFLAVKTWGGKDERKNWTLSPKRSLWEAETSRKAPAVENRQFPNSSLQ